jgi:hypothetical protein
MKQPAKLRPRGRRRLRRFVNKALKPWDLRLVGRRYHSELKEGVFAISEIAGELVEAWAGRVHGTVPWRCTGIVFSKDRPLQLHALLKSYFVQCSPGAPPLDVLYTASDDRYEQGYAALQRLTHEVPVTWHLERDFRADVQRLLAAHADTGVFFLVDDIVFIRPVDFQLLGTFPLTSYVPSLRLGSEIRYSYFWDRPLHPPTLQRAIPGSPLQCWQFDRTRSNTWNFPQSFDGNVLPRVEVEVLARSLRYRAPNSFEVALAAAAPLWKQRQGLCFDHARLINLALNRVQQELENRAGGVEPGYLLALWEQGQTLDVERLYDRTFDSVHAEPGVSFIAGARELSPKRA